MRKWAVLKPGCQELNGFQPRKIMIHSTEEGTYVYVYDAEDALFCKADELYKCEADALAAWEEKISPEGWHIIDDPLPDCQHDCILPIRVKGRNLGSPRWGEYELLENGEWKDI
ncbi:MAG: hypothetical protein IKX67_00575 [Bacteroidales bacterium]|nr:hypothetical protein [Bacteroidales bacterium]